MIIRQHIPSYGGQPCWEVVDTKTGHISYRTWVYEEALSFLKKYGINE